VDREDVLTQINKFDTSDAIKVHDKEITIIDGSNSTAILITVSAVGLLVILFFVLLARYIYNKMRAEKTRADQIRMTQQNLQKTG
jgi:cytochrome bd-type quinol oxidase subunit 2